MTHLMAPGGPPRAIKWVIITAPWYQGPVESEATREALRRRLPSDSTAGQSGTWSRTTFAAGFGVTCNGHRRPVPWSSPQAEGIETWPNIT